MTMVNMFGFCCLCFLLFFGLGFEGVFGLRLLGWVVAFGVGLCVFGAMFTCADGCSKLICKCLIPVDLALTCQLAYWGP